MPQNTDGQLTTEANIIRDETAVGANTALRVGTMLGNLIDSKMNVDKISNDTQLGNATTVVPTQYAVKTYVNAFATGLLTDNGNYDPTITSEYPTSGNTLSGGAVQKGDIWYIDTEGTMNGNAVLVGYSVRALIDNAGATTDAHWSISNVGIGFVPENVANKADEMGTSSTYYPTQNAVKTYVDDQIALNLPSYPAENSNNRSQNIALDPTSSIKYPSNAAVSSFVADNISTPSLQDVVAVNPTATTSFGCAAPTGAAITANSSSDPSSASIEAYTGAGGSVIITNENGNASQIRATDLTTFRTHQLPDADGIVALTTDITTFTRNFSITNAQLLTLGSTPINLFPTGAIPTGYILIPVSISFKYNYDTTPFTSNTSLNVGYWTGGGSITLMTTNILSYGSTYCEFTNMANVAVPIGGGFDGGNIRIFQSAFGNPVGGGGFLEVFVTYSIQSL